MNRAFSLIEIVIVVGIVVLIAGIIVFNLNNFRARQNLDNIVAESLSLLTEARSRTLASDNDTQYGVDFQTNAIVLFAGSIYVDGADENKVVELVSGVETIDISLDGGGSSVVFKRLTGETDYFGTITFGLTSDPTQTRAIKIYSGGAVSASSTSSL